MELFQNVVLLHVRVDHAHAEGELLLRGDLAQNVQEPVRVLTGTGTARRADDEGRFLRQCLRQSEGEVALDGASVREGFSASEVVRSGVGGAGIDADVVDLFGKGGFQRFFTVAVAEQTAEGYDLHI